MYIIYIKKLKKLNKKKSQKMTEGKKGKIAGNYELVKTYSFRMYIQSYV